MKKKSYKLNEVLAFPQEIRSEDKSTFFVTGMTLRDYFAAKALPSILILLKGELMEENTNHIIKYLDASSHMSYLIADTMLKERKKE